MIDYDGIRRVVVKGLREYLNCPVIRSNQNETPPDYPFISYTITTPMSENNGTYGEYEDGTDRKPFTQVWSISALSNDDTESVTLACKTREWFDSVGTLYLNDNNVIIQKIGDITNRDNILTVEYEYKKGFDIVLYLFDTLENPYANEYIEATTIGNSEVAKEPTVEELNEMLGSRLSGD